MPANNVTTLVYRGKLQYAKVLGDPIDNYTKDGKEWRFDFIPNDQEGAAKELRRLGVGDRLRTKVDAEGNLRYDGQAFMTFKQKALKADGTPNKPIRVITINGKEWPQDVLLGNGTVADVTFVVIDNGRGRFKGVYPRTIRVLDLVPYTKDEAAPLPPDDEYAMSAEEQERQLALLAGRAPNKAPEPVSDELLNDEIPID
jgi:hypothetical protein